MRRTRRLPPRPPQPQPDSSDATSSAQGDLVPDMPELARAPAPSQISIRRRLPVSLQINRDWFIAVVVLVAVGISAFLAGRSAFPGVVAAWWPVLVIATAAIVLIRSLGQRAGNVLLSSGTLFGFGISLLLATAFRVPLGQTWVGVTLIAIGLAIVLSGFG